MNLNKCIFYAIITSDIKYFEKNDTKIVNFSAGIPGMNDFTFINCKAFGKTAEIINRYLKNKMPFIISDSKISTEKWIDKNSGQERRKIVHIINEFSFVNYNKKEDNPDDIAPNQDNRDSKIVKSKIVEEEALEDSINDTVDIPF